MENIGDWIAAKRKEANLTLTQLAQLSGSDASTISRVENQRGEPTYTTVVMLCYMLGLSKETFIASFFGRPIEQMHYQECEVNEWDSVLNFSDLHGFKSVFRQHPLEACALLAALSNEVAHSVPNAELKMYKTYTDPRLNDLPNFTAESIFSMLFSTQLWQIKPQYPAISGAHVHHIYRHAGALTFEDVAVYVREKQAEQNINLLEHFSRTFVANLSIGALTNIKLNDAVLLDNLLGSGEILGMLWFVAVMNFSVVLRGLLDTSVDPSGIVGPPLKMLISLCRQLEQASIDRYLANEELPHLSNMRDQFMHLLIPS